MKKYYPVFFILCSLFIYSNAQAQLSLGSIIEASQEAERKRISNAPNLAPTLVPQARNQSRLGSYLVEQLTIQSQDPETNKRTARKIRSDIKKIERDLNRLDAGISEWEQEVYSKKLDKLTATFTKHTQKYNNIIEAEVARIAAVEQARIAAAKAEQERIAAAKAEQERIAAAKRAEEARIAAAELEVYKARCEPGSDDPFASFNAAGEPRMDLVLTIGSSRMKLQATKNGSCMWLGNAANPAVTSVLVTEESYLQNPNAKSQYIVYNAEKNGVKFAPPGIQSITPAMKFGFPTHGEFSLDFETYKCVFKIAGSSARQLPCDDGRPITVADIPDIINANCGLVNRLYTRNRVGYGRAFGLEGAAKLVDCNIPAF